MSKRNGRAGKVNRKSRCLRIETESVEVNDLVAGIDVSKPEMHVGVSSALAKDNVRVFRSFTCELRGLADWLVELDVREAAFEATGSYWRPLYRMLRSRNLKVTVFMPGTLKSFQRHKTDVMDCLWIRRLQALGELKNSFTPEAEVAEIRDLNRQKSNLSDSAGHCVQRMNKAMLEMNYRLDMVLSDLTGKSGLAIIEALLAGERDPDVLVLHRDRRVKASLADVRKALEGTPTPGAMLALRQALDLWKLLCRQTEECDARELEVLERLAERRRAEIGEVPDTPADAAGPRKKKSVDPERARLLHQIYGVDLTPVPGFGTDQITACLGEFGYDLSPWESNRRFAAWCKVAPRLAITGGHKVKGKRLKLCMPRAGRLFMQAAVGAGKTDTQVGARHRRLRRHLAPGTAVKATAHSLAGIFYAMVTRRQAYAGTSAATYDAQFLERKLKRVRAAAASMGMQLVPLTPKDSRAA